VREGHQFSYPPLSLWPVNKQKAPRTEAEKTGAEKTGLRFVAGKPGQNYYTDSCLKGTEQGRKLMRMIRYVGMGYIEAMQLIRPHTAIPIHYSDYTVFKSPLEDFKRAVAEAGLSDRVIYLSHGESYSFEA
jgi:hypothetical protein